MGKGEGRRGRRDEDEHNHNDIELREDVERRRRRDGSPEHRPWSHRKSEWDRAQLDLMHNLPSRQLGPGHGADGDVEHGEVERTWVSDVRRRNTRRKRRGYRVKETRVTPGTVRAHAVAALVNDEDMHNAGFLEDDDAIDKLRELKAPLATKREIKHQLDTMERKKRPDFFKQSKHQVTMESRKTIRTLQYYATGLWRSHFKRIASQFGSGVTSYFLFLRSLLIHNVIIALLSVAFVVVPQLLYRFEQQDPAGYTQNETFSPEQLITGGGWFEETVMYYGYYTHQTINASASFSYEMQYAYVSTAAAYLVVSVVICAVSLSRSYHRHHVVEKNTANTVTVYRVFCGWDYAMNDPSAAKLTHKATYIFLKEYLSKFRLVEDRSCGARCRWFCLRLLVNLVVLGVVAGSGFIVYYILTSKSLETGDEEFLDEMLTPFVITSMVFLLPFIFTILGHFEGYASPQTELHVTMARTTLLLATVLGVLMWYWLDNTKVLCWETFVGMQIYRLMLIDFVFLLAFTFFTEFIRRVIGVTCCRKLGKPEFNISRNTLSLVYSQTLVWLGSFYSPVLAVIQLVKLVAFFYVKRVSVVMNCAPPTKAWRGSRVQTFFRGLLLLMCVVSSGTVAYSIVKVEPSNACGPYRERNMTSDIVAYLRADLEQRFPQLSSVVTFLQSPGFVVGVLIALCVLVHYTRILKSGRKELVDLLLRQVQLEGKDKTYLLNQLQLAQERLRERRGAAGSAVLTSDLPPIAAARSGAIGTVSSAGPGGKVFSKSALKAAEEWKGSQSSLTSFASSQSPTKKTASASNVRSSQSPLVTKRDTDGADKKRREKAVSPLATVDHRSRGQSGDVSHSRGQSPPRRHRGDDYRGGDNNNGAYRDSKGEEDRRTGESQGRDDGKQRRKKKGKSQDQFDTIDESDDYYHRRKY